MNDLSILDNEPIARKELVIIYMVDTSRSMRGTKLRTVNRVVRETIPQLYNIGGSDIEIKVAAMNFDNDCHWMHPEPVPIEDFSWIDVEDGGWTNLGAACLELDSKLSRKEFMRTPSLSYAPVIILFSDGAPTDEYEEALYTLSKNKWFKHSIRVAFAIGKKAKAEKLSLFTGSPELVIESNNSKALGRMIRFVSLCSSEVYSSSSASLDDDDVDGTRRNRVVSEIRKERRASDIEFEDGW